MQTVVETPSYLAEAERLFSPDERAAVVDRLAADPTCGVVIPGSGGIRKVRFGFGARGKSGGARIIYVFSGQSLPVFILAVFEKRESQPFVSRAKCFSKVGHRYDRRLQEEKMTKASFDKIKAGLGEAKAN